MLLPEEEENFGVFRDCLSTAVIESLAPSPQKNKRSRSGGKARRKNAIKPVNEPTTVGNDDAGNENDAEELGEFTDYLATEIFPHLPSTLRQLSYANIQSGPGTHEVYTLPLHPTTTTTLIHNLPPSISDSLTTYHLIPPSDDDPSTNHSSSSSSSSSNLTAFLTPILSAYITSTSAPPPSFTPSITTTRPQECEICERDHLPLTYHHLIPRAMHAKVLRRGWHEEWALNKVAWLCRACHSFVHRVASNEELAREFYGVELLLEREDVQKWASWVGRVRWKAR